MHVTVNCEHALRQLRDPYTERHLWVDAICINQGDINERSHQVGIMDQIFSTANCVIMSIPYTAPKHSTSDSDASIEHLAPLFRWLHKPSQKVYKRNRNGVERALTVLLRSRYFQRAWVIQEIVLARKLRLRYATYEAEIFFPILEQIRQGFEPPPALNWSPGLVRQSDIISCLQAGFKCKARDRRDRIFAVLSLMEPTSRSLIPANYNLPIASVYCHAVIAVVASLQNLDILAHIAFNCIRESVAHLTLPPSLWATEFEAFVLKYDSHTYQSPCRLQSGNHLWKRRCRIEILQEPDNECTPVHRQNSPHNALSHCSIALAPPPPRDDAEANVMPQFHVRAHFIDTIVRHRDCHQSALIWENSTDRDRLLQGLWVRKYFSMDSKLEDLEAKRLEDFNVSENLGVWTNQSDLEEFKTCSRDLPGHDLFESQYSVGLVPRYMSGVHTGFVTFQEGDAIFAVDGVSTPLILRELKPGEYRIVSECYLWAALELDYWNPGTKKGRWGTRHYDHGCEQTRMITIV